MLKWIFAISLLCLPQFGFAQVPPEVPITRLSLNGPTGEYISQGRSWLCTPEDANFQLEHSANLRNGIRCWVYTPDRTTSWYVEIGGPDGTSPQVGVYTGAERFAFASPGQPRLDIHGNGRGCNQLSGNFEVKQVQYGPEGAVTQLWVVFDQCCDNCQGGSLILRGELLFQIDASTPTRPTTWGEIKSHYR